MFSTAQIKKHMEVVGSDGVHFATVDHMEGDEKIKLTKSDSSDDRHDYLPVHLVDRVDDKVHLKLPASEAVAQSQ